jgi:superoxide dismutase, Cu-Zn family
MTTKFVVCALVASALASSALASDGTDPAPDPTSRQARPVTVKLVDARGDSIGTATLSPAPAGVTIALAVKGLSPGEHAIHVHGTAKCEGPAFTSAGGHFNPGQKQHGIDNPQGPHAGDMPNFTVDATGRSTATVVAPGITLGDGPTSVFTGGGTALVIHEKADDMKSDPAGNAGARVACGVITK